MTDNFSPSFPNLNLPALVPGQAQKHVTVNAAMAVLDALVQIAALTDDLNEPPASPSEGDAHIVGASPSGAWDGQEANIAVYQNGAWQFHTPRSGWRCWRVSDNSLRVFTASGWKPAADYLVEFPKVGVNASPDNTNRLTVQSAASLFNHDGAGHQLKINKDAETDTASLVFQTAYDGHAEIGLAGNNRLQIRTSPDGSVFSTSVDISEMDGSVAFPQGTDRELLVPAVDQSGGAVSVYGPPNVHTVSTTRKTLSLSEDRLYFCPFFVDRPTELLGGLAAQTAASATSGAVLRAGVYKLGTPSGNDWSVGDLEVDFGVGAADAAGHKTFTLAQPHLLERGWYLTCVGVNGTGAEMRYAEWMTPGLYQYVPYGSGTSADFRVTGPARYLYANNRAADITGGLPQTFSAGAVSDTVATDFKTVQFVIPHWTRWA